MTGAYRSTAAVILACLAALTPAAAARPTGDRERRRGPARLHKVTVKDVRSGGEKTGFIDKTGRLVISFDRLPEGTEHVGEFREGLAAIYVKQGGGGPADHRVQAGYIDESGEIVIPPRFDYAGDFSEGLAFVKSKGFDGFIERRGNEVFRVEDAAAREFSEGLAAVGSQAAGGKWGYVDRSGRLVIGRKYSFADDFSEGLAGVVVGDRFGRGKFGFINKQGEMVIPPLFEPRARDETRRPAGTSRFSEGLACVRVGDLYGYIDKTGRFVIRPQFPFAQEFSEGLAWVATSEGRVGWIDKSGRWAVTVGGRPLPASLSLIYTHGFMDFRYSEGLVPYVFRSGGSEVYGYADKKGQVVRVANDIERPFLLPFSGGLARVSFSIEGLRGLTKGYGYVDRTGRFIWRSE